MLATVGASRVAGARVLDIGGGIGAVQAELLRAGADRGEVVELVGAYRRFAGQLAAELGMSDRSTFRIHDVLSDPSGVQPADVVVLNRVVCCAPEGVDLLGVAARLTRQVLLAQFPRDTRAVRAGARTLNLCCRVFGRSYRVHLHPRPLLVRAAEDAGLRLEAHGRGRLWEFVTFHRPPLDDALPAAG